MLIDPAPTEFPIQRAFRYEVGGGLLALDDWSCVDQTAAIEAGTKRTVSNGTNAVGFCQFCLPLFHRKSNIFQNVA